MSRKTYLAIDLGAESGRVIAGHFDGQRIELEELHRFNNGPVKVAGSLRWNLIGLWSEIQQGLGIAQSRFGDAVVSIGVDTWGVDYCLLDEQGELLGLPFNYRDPRTQGVLEQTLARVPRSEIFSETGLQFMEINTLYQLVAARQQNPRLLDLAARVLLIPDYFHWLLSGSQVVEFTNATTTQCLHPTRRDWAVDLLQKLDLNPAMFPEVVPPGTELGALRADVRDSTGLGRIPVIAPATHDTGSAVAAVPTESTGSPDWAYISSGTWSLMGVEIADANLSPRALQLNVTNEGGVDGTYRLLKNIMGLWLVQECRRGFERSGKPFDYDQLTQIARDARPFVACINPDDQRFLSPGDMPATIRSWCRDHNVTEPSTEGELVRTCLESLALKYRLVLEQLEELTGTRVQAIHIVGGGSRNALLNQFAADACQRPVIAGPVEATAMGNLLVQARSHGDVGSLAEIRDCVRASDRIERFEPTNAAQWDQAFGRFQELASE